MSDFEGFCDQKQIVEFIQGKRASMNIRNGELDYFVNTGNPQSVMDEVKTIVLMLFDEFNFDKVEKGYLDFLALFAGRYSGYKKCNTRYHDLKHTTDTLLALTRLIHGAFSEGAPFSKQGVALALISALMHDTGYIQEISDTSGTGAKYTLSHVDRSIDFMRGYFEKCNYSETDFVFCRNIIQCTGLDVNLKKIRFMDDENEMLGKMLGTADLQGQMADRAYLEKLLYLYQEFHEGEVQGYKNELDLLKKTPGFYEMTLKRFEYELDDVWRYMRCHFENRWGFDTDPYKITIEKHIKYLKQVIQNHSENYRSFLRRGRQIPNVEEQIKLHCQVLNAGNP